jgi:hypothetical protein
MTTIAIWAVAVLTSVATSTAAYKRTISPRAEAGQGTEAASNCQEIRALTLNGVSQVLRCEPEHSVAVSTKAASNCHEIRALALNGVSQVLRCEPEHSVAVNDRAGLSRRFSALGK